MTELLCGILVNSLGLIHALIGLPFVVGVAVIIAACGFIYKLGHTKTV